MINDTMRKFAATLLLGACLLAGCGTDEPYDEPGPGQNPGADGTVTISLNVPTPRTVGTYAMTAKQECDIVTVDVLVFDPSGEFLYREMGTGIADGVADNKKSFSVKIKKTSDPDKVTAFVYANVRDEIDAALRGWLMVGTTKSDVIEKLVFDLPLDTEYDNGGKWLVLPGRYTRFPMWGQTGTIDLALLSITIPEVNLIRAVAKIDVGLAFPTTGTQAEQDVAEGLNNFFLEEFYLYNAYNKLQVAPTANKLSGTTVTDPSVPAGKAIFPGTGGMDADSPISYARRTYNADGYKSFMNEIYLAEHEAGDDDDRSNNACIVVGGRFGTLASPVTYYRIDMVKTTYGSDGEATDQEYLDILRNHRYKVNITAVHTRGYDSPREAFDAMGLNTNLTVEITSQDERVTDVVYDGQYMLGVDRTTVDVDNRLHERKQIYINTDYPEGWKATSNAAWLTLDVAEGAQGGSELEYTVAAYTGTSPRSGTITLQAGRLFMNITVTQSHIADIVFERVENAYAMDGRPWTFTVKSNYNWKVRVDDEYNIVSAFDLEGIANHSGAAYNFTLVDNITMNLYVLWNKTAKLVFYSETGEFDPETVDIRGTDFFSLAGLDMRYRDQPTGQNWTQYTNSCAAMPTDTGNKWRLPSSGELSNISTAARGSYGIGRYNFVSGVEYWTATNTPNSSNSAYTIKVNSGSLGNKAKVNAVSYARCVRSK